MAANHPSPTFPTDIKGARVLNYGYNADGVFGNTTADVWDHAKSLLGSLVDEREADDVRQIDRYRLQSQLEFTHIT